MLRLMFITRPGEWQIRPTERPQCRKEFQQLLACLGIAPSQTVLEEKVGFGVTTASNGDRLLAKWEAHTEYYSYQIWHIPHDSNTPLGFGPLTFPHYVFPFSPLGLEVNALDILITPGQHYDHEALATFLPGPQIYASTVLEEDISVATSFTPDEHGRERYLLWSPDDLTTSSETSTPDRYPHYPGKLYAPHSLAIPGIFPGCGSSTNL